jgi:short-subunit dehydrogenase
VAGLCAEPTSTLYCSAKHALHGFYETLRLELLGSGVSITMCLPVSMKKVKYANRKGLVQSEMTSGGKSRDFNGKTLDENGRKLGPFAHAPLLPEVKTFLQFSQL